MTKLWFLPEPQLSDRDNSCCIYTCMYYSHAFSNYQTCEHFTQCEVVDMLEIAEEIANYLHRRKHVKASNKQH